MRFLSNILVKAGLVVEGSTSVATLSGGLVVGGTTQAGFRLDVQGTTRLTDVLIIGSSVAGAGVIRNNSTDGSLVLGGSAYVNNSLPARTIIISTVGTYTSLTGAANLFVGRSAGSSVTSGANNVFIGKGAGMGVTTGGANVIVSSSDASNLPSNLTNTIHLVAGGGYRLNDASLIPTAAHVFIGGGFGSSTALKDFYFGQLPFTPDAGLTQTDITFYAPSGSGTDIGGSDFTIAGGRGTGAGTPGDVILATSTATTSGTTLQTLTTRVRVAGGNGAVTVASLSGSGTRMVVADSSGVLSTQAIQTISSLGGVATSRTLTINGTSFDLSADRSWTVGDVRTDSTYANPAWITSLAWSKITGTPSFLTAESDTLATVTGRGASTSTVVTFSGGDGNNSSVKLAGYNLRGGTGFHGFLEATNTFGSATNPNKYFRLDSVGSLQIVNSAYTVAILTLTDAGALSVPGSVTAGSFVRSGGTSSQFLKADGSVDTNTYITGNQSISLSGDASGSGTTSISVTLANSGVTAGTYRSVTVDAKGRVTAGTNPTTLAGYGITDAASSVHTHDDRYYTETEINNFFSGTTAISGYNKSNWDTAFGWGNHGAQGYATQSFVTTQINNLVAGAPGLLDTLDELAAALGDDPNFATTVTTALSNRLRVDTAAQGLNSTQQSNGRTNLGLGSLATLSSVGNAQITDVAWSKVTGAPSFITGNQTITLSGDATGSGATAITVTLANSGVTAGTYTKVTVDAKGRVTSGTTLSAGDIPTLSYVAKSGDSMTGNLSFGSSGAGLTWAANTDGASITFESTGDGASGGRALSNLLIALTDNGDEGLKVTTTGTELLYVNTNQFQYKGNTIWHSANDGPGSGLDADLLDGVDSASFLRSDVVGATVTGTIISTNNANVHGPNFEVNTTNKTVNEYAYKVSRSGSAVGGILIDGRGAFASGTTVNGSTVWHQGNLTNLNQLTNGPGYITSSALSSYLPLTVSGTQILRFDTTSTEHITFQNQTSGGAIQLGFQQNDTDGLHHRAYFKAYKSSAGSVAGVFDIIIRSVGGGTTSEYFRLEAGQAPKWGANTMWHSGNLTNLNQLTNGPGYITGINSTMVTNALGYTPYNSTNPSGYITATNTDFTFNASLTLSTSWQNSGVTSANLTAGGVYIVTCFANDYAVSGSQYSCTYTGVMYWYTGGTNSVDTISEIPLHHSGHHDGGRFIFLRTLSSLGASDGKTYLQIRGNGNNSGASTYTFTFKRLM